MTTGLQAGSGGGKGEWKRLDKEQGETGNSSASPTEGAPAPSKAMQERKQNRAGLLRLPADLSQIVHGFPEQPRCRRCRAVTASQSLEEEGRGHSKGEEKRLNPGPLEISQPINRFSAETGGGNK